MKRVQTLGEKRKKYMEKLRQTKKRAHRETRKKEENVHEKLRQAIRKEECT